MSDKKLTIRYALSGAAAGLVNGLFGAGGGMVLVPLLVRYGNLKDKEAFSSSLFIILPLCLFSLLIYGLKSAIPLQTSLPYLLGGLAGGFLGGVMFRRVSSTMLHRILGVIILWGGIRLLC